MIACGERLEVIAVPGVPLIARGDDLGAIAVGALAAAGITLQGGDVLVVTSKVVSRAEDRFVDVTTVAPSAEAIALAAATLKDPRLVELVLRESVAISRHGKHVLIVRHRLGFVGANAGIDFSNAVPADAPPGSGPWALLLPVAPDASARAIRATLERASGAQVELAAPIPHRR